MNKQKPFHEEIENFDNDNVNEFHSVIHNSIIYIVKPTECKLACIKCCLFCRLCIYTYIRKYIFYSKNRIKNYLYDACFGSFGHSMCKWLPFFKYNLTCHIRKARQTFVCLTLSLQLLHDNFFLRLRSATGAVIGKTHDTRTIIKHVGPVVTEY